MMVVMARQHHERNKLRELHDRVNAAAPKKQDTQHRFFRWGLIVIDRRGRNFMQTKHLLRQHFRLEGCARLAI